jgi:multisubunit Na+/H+ antiporter MnhB subunit
MVSRLLLAPAFMVALATLVKGYVDAGDGFAAGVIAALAVGLQFVAFGADEVERTLPVRFAPAVAAVGLVVALMVTFVPILRGDPLLTHLPRPGAAVVHLGTLELLTAVLFDVGVFLLVLGFGVETIRLLIRAGAGRRLP